ncbi:hypothetical protein [Actinoplanes friuliensis]|uniref:hypothetical protein n=1 Tax=Actinoplanes friuliensis TaxID=196914 RepID=UPI0004053BFA|nr:hypothetical protein [Actinoplanes friuliensis]
MRSHTRAGRTTSRVLAAGAVAALLVVSGCSDSGSSDDKAAAVGQQAAAAAAGPPVISEADAKALMTKITAANNKANLALDPEQVGGYEAEASLASDAAGLISYVGRPLGEFDYELETLLAPSSTAGADFFVADAVVGSATQHYPLVLAKAGADWKVVHSAPLEVPLPELQKGAAGSVEVVDRADPAKTLLISPEQVAQEHATALGTAGGKGPFAGDATSAKVVESDQAREQIRFEDGAAPDALDIKTTVTPYPVRALRTKDGGALVAYSTQTEFVATKAGAEADLGPILTKLGGRTAPGKVSVTILNMWWTKVPAMGKGDKVTVLGGTNQPVSVK